MWILATILGLILLFVLLLSIPIHLRLNVEKDESFRSWVRVTWLFGLIGKDLERKKKERKPKKKKPKKRLKARRHIKPLLALARSRGFIRRSLRLLRDIRRVIQIRELSLDIRFGLDDPADTAMIFGAVGPAAYLTDHFSPLHVRVRPDFEDSILEGSFKGDMKLVPIRLLKPITLFALSPVTIRALKNVVFAYRK